MEALYVEKGADPALYTALQQQTQPVKTFSWKKLEHVITSINF